METARAIIFYVQTAYVILDPVPCHQINNRTNYYEISVGCNKILYGKPFYDRKDP